MYNYITTGMRIERINIFMYTIKIKYGNIY